MVFIITTMRLKKFNSKEHDVSIYRSDIIIALREAFGWSQESFCEKAGISRPTLIDAEAGRDIKTTTINRIADAFGVDKKILFDADFTLNEEALLVLRAEADSGKEELIRKRIKEIAA